MIQQTGYLEQSSERDGGGAVSVLEALLIDHITEKLQFGVDVFGRVLAPRLRFSAGRRSVDRTK